MCAQLAVVTAQISKHTVMVGLRILFPSFVRFSNVCHGLRLGLLDCPGLGLRIGLGLCRQLCGLGYHKLRMVQANGLNAGVTTGANCQSCERCGSPAADNLDHRADHQKIAHASQTTSGGMAHSAATASPKPYGSSDRSDRAAGMAQAMVTRIGTQIILPFQICAEPLPSHGILAGLRLA